MHGLRSLGLIEEDGTVKQPLVDLVAARGDERRALMRSVLNARYPEAVALGQTNATTGQLLEVFRDYGAQGDTARKGIAFYLAAAEYAGVQLSPNFKTPSVPRGQGGSKRSKTKAADEVGDENESVVPPPPPPPSNDFHPVIRTLVESLPKFEDFGSKPEFSTAEREAWFAYARAMFNLIYTLPEGDTGGSS
jgi:hypothetical protein